MMNPVTAVSVPLCTGLALGLLVGSLALHPAQAAASPSGLTPCRLPGVDHHALCGTVRRPLDPAAPEGAGIDVHFAVLPALARNAKPDPVFFFAGGPGQSAIEIGWMVSRMLSRLSNRRDLVLIDQRGTGRSAPLTCDEPEPTTPLAVLADDRGMLQRLRDCGARLQQLPHGDLRHYTTTVAMQDADAVRQVLGAEQINIVGGSYGTRAALEYLRQYPTRVRRAVLDGVAPPDMALPASFSRDNQAALEALFQSCAAQPGCAARYPELRADWQALLATLPREVSAVHPVTGVAERFRLSRDAVLSQVRGPLYAPVLASALPHAISEGARGRFEPLMGLGTALTAGRRMGMAEGMHFSVVCAEDLPRLAQSDDAPGVDFGDMAARLYGSVCENWPRGAVPAAFYTLPVATGATLVLSGGADPVTPPRHGERVTQALGSNARHVVVPEAGHGVMGIGCMRDVLFRFIDAASDAAALKVDADCALHIPRPLTFVPVGAR